MEEVTVGVDSSRELDLPARHTEPTSTPFNEKKGEGRGERD